MANNGITVIEFEIFYAKKSIQKIFNAQNYSVILNMCN